MLGVRPFWMANIMYVLCTGLALFLVILSRRWIQRLSNAWFVFDTLGLALFTIASIGLVLIYFFRQTNLIAFVLGIILAVLGILAMLVFGYGIYKGRLNLQRVIDDFEEKLRLAR